MTTTHSDLGTSEAVDTSLGITEDQPINDLSNTEAQPNNKALATDVLTPVELSNLVAAGLTPEEISAIQDKRRLKLTKEVGDKVDLPKIIEDHAAQLREQWGGKTLASAKTVGLGLKRLGAYDRSWFNGVGDSLGRRGHSLPYVAYAGRKQYDLGFIGKSREEKANRQKELRELGTDVIARMVVSAQEAVTEKEEVQS